MSNFSHLLSKHGVLASFNIARKIKTEDIENLKKQMSDEDKKHSTSEEFFNKLKTMISLQEPGKTIDDIPGLIINRNKSDMMVFYENLPTNLKFSMMEMSNKFCVQALARKLTTDQILVSIQLIFNQLGISTEDLRNFNKKFRPPQDIDDEDDDEDDYEEED